MNKRHRFLFIFASILSIIIFSACGKKALDPLKTGEILVQQLVYDKEEALFDANFKNGDTLRKKLTEYKETIGLAAVDIGENLSSKESREYIEELQKRMQEVAKYKVSSQKEGTDKISITYEVYGLDYAAILNETLNNLGTEMMENEIIRDDHKALDKLTALLFKQAIRNGKVKTEPLIMTLFLVEEKGKWVVEDEEIEQAMNLYLAFLTGNANIDDFSIEMNRVIQRAITQQNEDFSN